MCLESQSAAVLTRWLVPLLGCALLAQCICSFCQAAKLWLKECRRWDVSETYCLQLCTQEVNQVLGLCCISCSKVPQNGAPLTSQFLGYANERAVGKLRSSWSWFRILKVHQAAPGRESALAVVNKQDASRTNMSWRFYATICSHHLREFHARYHTYHNVLTQKQAIIPNGRRSWATLVGMIYTLLRPLQALNKSHSLCRGWFVSWWWWRVL